MTIYILMFQNKKPVLNEPINDEGDYHDKFQQMTQSTQRPQSMQVQGVPTNVNQFTSNWEPSVQFNNNTQGLVKNYIDSFIKWDNSPFCSPEQLREIHLLIDEINKYRLNDSNNLKVSTKLTSLQNRLEKFKNYPTDKRIEALVATYSGNKDVHKKSEAYTIVQESLANKLNDINTNEKNIKRAEFSFNKKRVFGEAAQDLANLTHLQYIQSSINTDQEVHDIEVAKSALVSALKTQLQNTISNTRTGIKHSRKKLFVSDSTKVKCQEDSVNRILNIFNLDIIFGDSIKDPSAKRNIGLVITGNSDNFTLSVKITGLSATPEIFKIMVPRSIFIIDLQSQLQSRDVDVDFVISSLANAGEKQTKEYYDDFVNYILSFVDNLNSPRENNTTPFVLADKNNNPTKILGFRDETYIVNEAQDRQYIIVKIYNFESFKVVDAYNGDPINITASLEISILPRHRDNPNITFGGNNEDYIKITEYPLKSANAKKFGVLNIIREHRKILENQVLFPEVSFCSIL